VRIWICGVRGSTPVSGTDYLRYGGHTSCVAIAHDGHVPSLVIDAGTGIRRVDDMFGAGPGLLGGQAFAGSIILGHLHWDHVQGLPFFGAANHPDARTDLYLPAGEDARGVGNDSGERAKGGVGGGGGIGGVESLLERFMSPPFFPIPPSGLAGTWRYIGLVPGVRQIEGFTVTSLEIPHSTGRTYGLRIEDGKTAIAYLSDHCPTRLGPGPDGLGELHDAALTLANGVDLLLHDAQYSDEELPERARFGHASCGYAVSLAEAASVRQLLLFHHDPARRDDEIDELVSHYVRRTVQVDAASETMVIDLPKSDGTASST